MLVLRIWAETDQSSSVRARIMADSDYGAEGRISVAGGSVDDVVALVRDWVEEFIVREQPGGT